MTGTMIISGASLTIDGEKVRGINLNQVRQEMAKGKRAVVFWVIDYNEAKRVKKQFSC